MGDEVYYTPQIVAFQLGFFRDEGLDVEFVVGNIADLPLAVTSGEADFALCGLWQPWVYAERLGMPLVAVAELNQQSPLMLFGRVSAEDFDWSSLNGGTFHHTSVMATAPWCALQALLRAKDVDLGTVRFLLGFQPAESRQLFKAGSGDVLEIFGFGATPLLADPDAHLLVDWGADLGTLPWSIYYTSRDRLPELHQEAVGVTKALYRAQQWVREHPADEIAAVVAPWFPTADERDVELLVDAYHAREQWPANPAFDQESVERWREFLLRSGLLAKGAPYGDIVADEIAAEAMAG
jgi:NitT/TauT family transport system substrate-binding protein